ncbi:TraR/DksA C4-type zinc finger protein [Lederbergia lenta]|uniref:TraR/DksA family transcriptional regulator n=1 Tax=Lederbergia lenta TaxID=1467 RepID=A0A2X4WUU8_LEDLE|nr:TraR/DksA C4-type zinc finger protein [Lederbergia lenta]MEC2326410.1 TraR/DksA C4-type zinc finger protein [Lederbergia lenta]SQI61440.1 TraR/DksA family transcriptional regulator [Lederbergia lenta]
MLTDKQIKQLKEELFIQQKQLKETEEETTIEENNVRDNTGELSLYDNHPGDMGTELFEREKDLALSIHAETELDKVNKALQAIDDGTYGKCTECGQSIPFDRLEAIPYTTTCVEHSNEQILPGDRPVEEDIIQPAVDNSFAGRNKGNIRDYQDSFQEVAKYGTSETPSDFEGDYDNYNELYEDEIKDGFTEEYETFAATDISGKSREVVQTDEVKAYENKLDNSGTDTPFGDIPYKETDGYVDDTDS